MKIVIVGASYAGVSAALAARERYPEATICLLDKQETLGFLPSGLLLYLRKEFNQLEEACFVTVEQLTSQKITLVLAADVTLVKAKEHQVVYLKDDKTIVTSFDKLILATGSEQKSTAIINNQTAKILAYKTLPQAQETLKIIEQCQCLTIVGGGQIGVEMADSLVAIGKQVTLIESMDGVLLKYFDSEMVVPLKAEMEKQGVNLFVNETVAKVEEAAQQLIVTTQHQKRVTEGVLFALSVKPNLAYLGMQLDCHEDQTIAVDSYLQTSFPHIFAIGDCIQTPYSLAQESFYIALVNNAVRSGRVVIENLLEPTVPFVGSIRTIGTKVFDYYLASSGMTEAESVFFEEEVAVSHQTQLLGFGKSQQKVWGKIVYNRHTEQVLGAQLVSQENILEKINTLSLAIQMKMTMTELAQKDYFYHPSFNQPLDFANQLGWLKK